MKQKTKFLSHLFLLVALLCGGAQTLFAQEVFDHFQGTYRGRVLEIQSTEWRDDPLLGGEQEIQTIKVEFLDGERKGEVLVFENDYLPLRKNQKFYVNHVRDIDGRDFYAVVNIDRRAGLLAMGLVFVLAVIVFGRWQGVRSLIALAASFAAIFLILLPGILNGWNPLWASFLVSAIILFGAIFFTHGFNREASVAFGGTMIAVFLSGLFAIIAVHATSLSGFSEETSIYLNFNTGGTINFTALLLGAFIIGFLGVLDDISITQAAIVTELYQSNTNITQREVFERAMRVGREHVGALVNTLVLAYTGAALPLLLYFSLLPLSFGAIVNMELFATEIVRTVVGSIGLILTVPIVTGLGVIFLKDYVPKHTHGHSHAHGHTHKH
ncbi:MAG: YibE/F family protein [Candidatus Pacebacteria bacterium]|nr:YibE/F family protein [Candidatus Paceibacterota bacterium]MCD8508359.1 YibE/F family protein [Candidatus Paceibacterota bacterium]MCD8528372.1 YibE/F family protein [Candidatus Paceibacterota bacterium]MCD8563671.1 YibE/F family protein [Candidatus Paceibacterota bacterium]